MTQDSASPDALPSVWIDTPDALQQAAERWHHSDAIAIDTEFVRERTFYPGLGLVQVADATSSYLIDPLALDLKPLQEVLRDPSVVKVLHACSEDLEVFWNRFQELPWPLFDTQIASAFAGLALAVSYRSLVEELRGVDVPKGETRTNWLRRPLLPAQIEYAALDVVHLLPCYENLRQRLRQRGQEAWALEEMERLRNTSRFQVDTEKAYLKIKKARGLTRRQLAILQELAAWRELQARERNLPRNFVVPEAALTQIARLQPRDASRLGGVEGLRTDQTRRYGRAIVEIVRRVVALPTQELPPEIGRPLDLSPHRDQLDRLREVVATTADELDIPAELLATRRAVEAVMRRSVLGEDSPLSPELDGWRGEALGDRFLEILKS
jgi:ribonuclease D